MLEVGRLGVRADEGYAGLPLEMFLTHSVPFVIDIRRCPRRSGNVE